MAPPPITAKVWSADGGLFCEVTDAGDWRPDALVGYLPPHSAADPGFGLWGVTRTRADNLCAPRCSTPMGPMGNDYRREQGVLVTGPRSAHWFLREPSPDAGARLFCLPYSGCGVSMYRKWPRRVADIEVCPVQFPGRENRVSEDPFTSFGLLADMLGEALVPYLDRPFAFFGHGGSALVAYETALSLERRGYRAPARIFVSSQVAPHKGPHGRFLEMSEDELRVEVSDLTTQFGGTPRPDVVELSLQVLMSDVEAHTRYVSGPTTLPCPASVLGWDQDVEVPPGLLHDWSDLGETTFRVLEGPHYGFIDGPEALMNVFEMDLGCAAEPNQAGSVARSPQQAEIAARAELEAALLRRLHIGRTTIPRLPRPDGTARFPVSLTQEEDWLKYGARPDPVAWPDYGCAGRWTSRYWNAP